MLDHYLFYPFVGSIIIAVVTGLISPLVILRKASFTCHMLGHNTLTGYLIVSILGCNQLWGQIVVNMLFVTLILLTKMSEESTRVGVVSNLCLGIGIYLLYQYQQSSAGATMAIFYGSLFTMNQEQLWLLLGLALVTVLFYQRYLSWYLFMLMEPVSSSRYIHTPRLQIDVMFHLILAAVVTVTCQLVGSLLVFTLLVGPGTVAMQWQGTFQGIFWLSVMTALGTVVGALLCSCYLLPSAPVNVCATMIISILYGIGELRNLKKPE